MKWLMGALNLAPKVAMLAATKAQS
jgi:hypothetical protein